MEAYDPATDSQIARTYDRVTRQVGKLACKQALQEEIGLPQRDDIPLAVMISRLVDQKGIDLLLRVLDEMLHADIQVAVLGTGEAHYEQALREIAGRNPTRLAICLTYDTALSHRFYAGADLFLMPSLFEPCGLSQMIAMRYGTLPVVRETGGLKDTVIPYNEYTGEGNGFSFLNINAHELLYTVQRAAALWRSEPVTWQTIVDQAMSGDYSGSALPWSIKVSISCSAADLKGNNKTHANHTSKPVPGIPFTLWCCRSRDLSPFCP